MSAREPFARYDDTDDVVRVGAHEWRVYDGDVMVDELNSAHADRVAAELEAAAEDFEGRAARLKSIGVVTGANEAAYLAQHLRARAKEIREGGAP